MNFLNLHSIRNKLALLTLLTIAPCLAILLYSGIERRHHLIGMAQSDVLLLTHTIAEAQKTVAQSTQQLLITLSKTPSIQSMEPNECSAVLSHMLEKNSQYNNFALVDLKGEVIASGKPFAGVNLAESKNIKEALENNDFAAGEYIVTKVGNAIPSFAFAYPVPDKEGNPKGVLAVSLKLNIFSNYYDFSQLPEKSFLAITDYKGIRIFYYPAQEKTNPLGKPIQATAWEIASKGEKEGFFFGMGADGLRRIFAYVKIYLPNEDTPYLYVWAGIPESHILAPANAALIRNLLLLLLATVISLFISWAISRKTLISPIQRLVILTQKFAKGDLEARGEPPVQAGELGILANAFHDMAEFLTMSRKELEESEEKYRLFFEKAGDTIFIHDLQAKILAANPMACQQLGYSHAELLSMTVAQVDAPEQALEFPDRTDRLMKCGHLTFETVHRHKDGSRIPIEVNTQLITWEGKPAAMSICRDITERKSVEIALRETNDYLENLFNYANMPIIVWDPQFNIIRFNQAFENITGKRTSDVLGKPLEILFPPEKIEVSMERIRKTLTGERWKVVEIGIQHTDGSIRTVLWNSATLFSPDTKLPIATIAQGQDITEHKQAEEDLRASEEKFRTVADHIYNWEYWTAQDGNLIYVSPSSKRITSYTDTEFYQDPGLLTAIIHPDDRENFMRHLEDIKENVINQVCQELDFRILTRDGQERWIGHNCQKVFNREGKSIGHRVSNRDITERKAAEWDKEKMQAQYIQAQKMESVGHLAGGVAHDFNNMLSVILGYGNIILETIPTDDPLHECAQEIVDAGTRSASITRQLLAFARKQTIAPQVLDLNETIEEMLKMLRRLIGEDIDLNWHPSAVWPVNIDPSQLDQLLANLCVNARDAINGVGKITIETETTSIDETYCSQHPGFTPGEFVLLSISDDGIGMDSDTVSRIFEPFFTTKEIGKGTGLGLATVYGIVKQNQGFVNVYSEPGQGTTFRIYLPRHTEQITASEKKKEDVIMQGRGETILVVEDEASILKLASRILSNFGYVVLSANSPQEAVKLAKEHDKTIDLLITDVIMPEINGRDLANTLLALHPDLKCLFMSGYTSTVIADKGVLEEGTHFIQKPFAARELCVKVDEVLKTDKGNVS